MILFDNLDFNKDLSNCRNISFAGSNIKPKHIAEYIITFTALLFTIVICNAYSAFITSVLSVQLVNIRTVDDLLESDYEIGYAKNSEDEIYLRVSLNLCFRILSFSVQLIFDFGKLHSKIV